MNEEPSRAWVLLRRMQNNQMTLPRRQRECFGERRHSAIALAVPGGRQKQLGHVHLMPSDAAINRSRSGSNRAIDRGHLTVIDLHTQWSRLTAWISPSSHALPEARRI